MRNKKIFNFTLWRRTICFASISLLSWGNAAASGESDFSCAFEEASQALYAEHPGLEGQVAAASLQNEQVSTLDGILGIFNPKEIRTYTIPIVFHVIHGNGAENITDKQIQDAVNLINDDYNGREKDKDKIFSEFSSIYANVGMSFVLARKDPSGNPTDGITRHYAPQHTTQLNTGMDKVIKEKYGWPQDKYLNVYVLRSAGGQSGSAWAYLPEQVNTDATKSLDGVTSSHWAIGRSGTAAPTHYKTLTHEIGHWANLKHTFEGNCDTTNDGVADTPPTLTGSGCDKRWEPCTAGTIANSQNYMDYGFCQKMFTNGQKTRMVNAMTSTVGKRSSLYSSANLTAAGINGMAVNALFYTDKNAIMTGSSVTITDDSEASSGSISGWQWTFAGGTPATHNGKTPPKIKYNTAGTYDVTLTVTQGSNTNTVTKKDYITVSNDIVMRNDVVKTCSSNFYDSGNNHDNVAGYYGGREDHKLVVLPSNNNSAVRVTFNSFLLENNSNCDLDYLKVYNGIDESATLLGHYCGNTNPGTLSATNSNGALTFVFHSDVKSRAAGWDADLSCTSGTGGGNVAPSANANGPYAVKATVNNTYSSAGSKDIDGEIASYSWNWGDGSSNSTQANPSKAYNSIGTYNGTLTVTDDSGATATSNFTVTVRANVADPLIVEANGPYHGVEGKSVTFSSAGTGDLDTAISSYSWNFGDSSTAATVADPSHTFKKPGTYTVTLTVKNAANQTVTDTASVVIDDDAGTAPPAMTNACGTATANGAQIAHNVPICVAAITGTQKLVSYSFPNSYGTTVADAPRSIAITTQGGSGNIELIFKAGGWPNETTYDVKSSLSGNNECIYLKHQTEYWAYAGVISSGTGTTLAVDFNTSGCRNNGANKSPTASIAAPSTGATGAPIYFNGSASKDDDGVLVTRAWNFGDGGSATISATNHTFTSAGTYNVTHTVTDAHGATNTATHSIVISGSGSSSGGSSSGGSSSGGSSSGGSSSGGSSSGGSSSGGSSSGGSSSGGSSSGGSSSGGSSSGGCAGATGCLTNGVAVTGLNATAGNRTGNYYIDVPAGATDLKIVIAAGTGATGDADLYVKKGSVPTDSSYDCRPYDSGNAETCGTGGDTLATSEGRFHINLKAYSSFTNVTLTASYTGGGSSSGGSSSGGSSSGGSSSGGSSSGGSSSGGSSSGGSSSGGSSSGGSSSGGSSSGGSSSGGSSSGGSSSGGSSSGGSSSGGSSSGGCAGATGCLDNGVAVTGLNATAGNRTSNYYVDVPAGATGLKIEIAAGTGATGDADLYVKKGSVPTDSSYDCRPYKSGNAEICGTGGTALATSEGRFHINLKAYSNFTNVTLTASYTAGSGSSSGGSSSGGSSSGGSSSGGSSSGGSSSGGSSSGGSSSGGSSSGGSSSGGSSSGGSSSGGSSSGGIVDACASQGPSTGSAITSGTAICLPAGTSANAIQYRYINIPANTTSLTIQTAHGTGNGNLYYNASTWATTTANTQSSTGSTNTETITVNNPATGYRFFSVTGIQSGMTLLATASSGSGNQNTDGGSSSGGGSSTTPYCAANGGGGYEWIANVEANGFSNASGDGDYEDHTGQTITLNQGSNVITLTPGGTYKEHWKVWIDFNEDGDFSDAGEEVLGGLSGKGAVNGNINIPAGTSVSTTMRVAMRYNSDPASSCGDIGDGEVEDYSVNIGIDVPSGDSCGVSGLSEGELSYDQNVCTSRSNSGENYYYIDVENNNTRLYITISGGTGNANILYNSDENATATNRQYWSNMDGNDETLEVTADAGRRYISLNTSSNFDNVNLVVSTNPPASSDGGDGSNGIGDGGATTANDPDCALADTSTTDAELSMYGFANKVEKNYLQSWVRIQGTTAASSKGEYVMKFCPPKYGFIQLDYTGFEKVEANGTNGVQYASRFNYYYNHFGSRADNNETVKVITIIGSKKAVWTMPIDLASNPVVNHPVSGTCNDIKIDADFDGIPDCAEASGKTFYNMPLYEWGARPNQMDVFIEVDYHAKHDLLDYAGQYILDANNQRITDHGTEPTRKTIDRVVKTFKDRGIHLHVDVGDLFDKASGTDPNDYDLGGGQAIPLTVANQYIHLARWTYNATHGTIQVPGMVEDIMPTYFDNKPERKAIFYYALFGHQQGGSNRGSSGIAPDLHDRYFIVSLGGQGWKLNDRTTEDTNRLVNLQSATFIHEFGHIIGLSHDGFPDDTTRNFKINYPSVMNYLFQLQGVPPEAGYNDVSYNDMVRMRHFLNRNKNPDLICNEEMNAIHANNKTWGNLIRGTSTNPDNIYIGFSDGKQAKIDETNTSEGLLLGGTGLDVNCDGNIINPPGTLDVNGDDQINYLWDYDDWGYLTFFFHYYNYDVKNEYDTSNNFMLTPNYHAQWGSSPTDVKYPGRSREGDSSAETDKLQNAKSVKQSRLSQKRSAAKKAASRYKSAAELQAESNTLIGVPELILPEEARKAMDEASKAALRKQQSRSIE